jgi:hypothetical protein
LGGHEEAWADGGQTVILGGRAKYMEGWTLGWTVTGGWADEFVFWQWSACPYALEGIDAPLHVYS